MNRTKYSHRAGLGRRAWHSGTHSKLNHHAQLECIKALVSVSCRLMNVRAHAWSFGFRFEDASHERLSVTFLHIDTYDVAGLGSSQIINMANQIELLLRFLSLAPVPNPSTARQDVKQRPLGVLGLAPRHQPEAEYSSIATLQVRYITMRVRVGFHQRKDSQTQPTTQRPPRTLGHPKGARPHQLQCLLLRASGSGQVPVPWLDSHVETQGFKALRLRDMRGTKPKN